MQNRANLYRRQGMLREAEADYTKAIEIQPSSVKALINRGALLREQNLTVRAHRDLCVCSTNQRRPIASRAFPHHFPSACAGLADERIVFRTRSERALAMDPSNTALEQEVKGLADKLAEAGVGAGGGNPRESRADGPGANASGAAMQCTRL